MLPATYSQGAFYALKDARTPLFTNIFSLLVRTGLIIFLLKLFVGKSALIAISLAASGAVTPEALLLGYLLYLRLRAKIRQEKNAQIQAQEHESAVSQSHQPGVFD